MDAYESGDEIALDEAIATLTEERELTSGPHIMGMSIHKAFELEPGAPVSADLWKLYHLAAGASVSLPPPPILYRLSFAVRRY